MERSRPRPARAPARERRWRVPVGSTEIIAVLAVAAILAMALDGRGPQVSTATARVEAAHITRPDPVSGHLARGRRAGQASRASACPMISTSTGYVNPLAGARVKRERIDQGVDYAGRGTLTAIGVARVSQVATENTGWPGPFIEYQLLTGPDTGCYVYYAEGVTPRRGLRVGQIVSAGQVIATIVPQYPTGFEIGWSAGDGTKTYAALTGGWTSGDDQDNVASGPGRRFSALVAALGGPAGKVEV